ncbi:response regulator [Pseudoalteromonas sp. YIC-656]|uniref:response regulator n=1 Tax=Pseudoalteromonas pernae TaxID=3118054 RepID=UPI003242D084
MQRHTNRQLPQHSKVDKDAAILVIESTFAYRQQLSALLAQYKFSNLKVAVNGVEALRVLETSKVDVVISCWDLADISGVDILKYVRNSQRLSHTYVMLLAHEQSRDELQNAVSCGVDEMLIKPFTNANFHSKFVRMVCENPRTKHTFNDQHPDNTRSPALFENELTLNQRILVVDDVADNLALMRGILQSDYQVFAVNNAKDALNIAFSDNKPDLILLDIVMPEMDGYEVCKRLKADESTRDIPVIFLTAKSDVTDMSEGFNLGAVDFVTKPANSELLKVRIATQLKIRAHHNTIRNEVDLLLQNAKLRESLATASLDKIISDTQSILTAINKMGAVSGLPSEVLKDINEIQHHAESLNDIASSFSQKFGAEIDHSKA